MDPLPPRVVQELYTSGENIQSLRVEIREAELEAQKKRLVDTFYKEVRLVMGCAPTVSTMTCSAYWTPYDKKILITTTRGGGLINTGLEVRGGWYRCTAEIAGTHWLHVVGWLVGWLFWV